LHADNKLAIIEPDHGVLAELNNAQQGGKRRSHVVGRPRAVAPWRPSSEVNNSCLLMQLSTNSFSSIAGAPAIHCW
jgi:hypothetical protein